MPGRKRRVTTITLDPKIIEGAREYNLNISRLSEEALREKIGELESGRSMGVAKLVERALFPPITVLVGAALAVAYTRSPADALAVAVSFLAYALSALAIRRRIEDENKLHCLAGLVGMSALLPILALLGVSGEVAFGAVSLFFVITIVYLIRPRWRVSAHVTAAAGVWAVLSLIDLCFMPLVALLPITVWSRLKLRAHTPGQVLAGVAIGLAVPAAVLWSA